MMRAIKTLRTFFSRNCSEFSGCNTLITKGSFSFMFMFPCVSRMGKLLCRVLYLLKESRSERFFSK